jgi:hypothetical protein
LTAICFNFTFEELNLIRECSGLVKYLVYSKVQCNSDLMKIIKFVKNIHKQFLIIFKPSFKLHILLCYYIILRFETNNAGITVFIATKTCKSCLHVANLEPLSEIRYWGVLLKCVSVF